MVSRREFLAWGAASGAVAATGVVVPVALSNRDGTQDVPGGSNGLGGGAEPGTPPAHGVVTLYPRVRIGSLAALGVGDSIDFDYPTRDAQASLFRLGRPAAGGIGPDRDVVAFATDCTHMGCPLRGAYNADHGVLGPCGCHFTTFDLSLRGQVVIGQATESLPQIVLDLDDDDIFAVGTLGLVYGFRDNLADAVLVEGL